MSASKSAGGYISAKETVLEAKKQNLSVCDYVERQWNQQGATQKVIDQIMKCGVFSIAPQNVLEIGAGTGRYTEKVIGLCNTQKYEIYETAKDWADWLSKKYDVITYDCDGKSLSFTRDKSIDILYAHGVFVYLPFLITMGYFKEIIRVMKDGGYVIFDIYSEVCMDEQTVERWLQSEHRYPCFLSAYYVCEYFKSHGHSVVRRFLNPYGMGFSEYLVFKKSYGQEASQ